MSHLKRNRSIRKVGHGRGVPLRLARGIAKKYSLTHIVMLTFDTQKRSRTLYWANGDQSAMQCAHMCEQMALQLGWNVIGEWDCASVRKLKDQIKSLERDMALIVEKEEDPIVVARRALKLPEDV